MRVKGLREELSEKEKDIIGAPKDYNYIYEAEPGKEYTVLGISFNLCCPGQNGTFFYIYPGYDTCFSSPHFLFEIIDPRPSVYWQARISEKDMNLWPKEFYRDYFYEDVADGDAEAVSIFWDVVKKMELEFHPVREVLLNEWDPLNVRASLNLKDSYNLYLKDIEGLLRDHDYERLYKYLALKEEDMGVAPDTTRLKRVVDRLLTRNST